MVLGASEVGIPRWDSAFRRAALRPASLNCLRAPGFAPAVRSRGGTDSVLLGQAAIPTPLGAAVREAHGNRPVALWPVFESRMTINDSADRKFGLYRKHLLQIWILNSTGWFWPNLKGNMEFTVIASYIHLLMPGDFLTCANCLCDRNARSRPPHSTVAPREEVKTCDAQ